MKADLSEVRRRAWETRREVYGSRGHSGPYRQTALCRDCERMRDMLVRLHNEGVLSEGQAVKATGLGRFDLRKRADALRDQSVAESVTRGIARET
jgi:hypothetical protein